MLPNLMKIFRARPSTRSGDPSKETQAESQERLQIATAIVLLEVAHADQQFDKEEEKQIVELLQKRFTLTGEAITELLELSSREREGSVDIWHYTHKINENFSDADKILVMEMVWQVIFADGRMDKYEDHIAHKLANLLHVPHDRMIEAKLKYMPHK